MFRLKFAPTVFSARQLVNHGHVLVNGKVVNKKSYQVNDGDEISLQQTSQNIPMIIQTLSSNERDVPEYLQLEISKCLGKFVRGPQLTMFLTLFKWNLILLWNFTLDKIIILQV